MARCTAHSRCSGSSPRENRSARSIEKDAPYAPIRWVNEWNNIDGSIERGYGGRSIFWEGGHIREDLSRVSEYGRLLASLGINGISINNVNANPLVLSPEFVPQVARVADVLRPWGVRLALAIDFGSPQSLGKLPTYDPLDPAVIAWWKARADDLYKAIPDFGGFVLKADSEGRVGPSAYGRTHADAANVVARALAPHGGVIFYRGFVYDHHMDWNNPKNDRARAAYDNFRPLDGQFDANAIIQIKHGPIDFQVREPSSPLFGALERTNQAIELQITQEYMGQARHTVFLPPMWKETLDFDMHVGAGGPSPVKAIVSGKTFHRPLGGVRRRVERRTERELVRQSPVAGQPLRLWTARLESRPDVGANRRRMDAADLRKRSASRAHGHAHSAATRGRPTSATPVRSGCRR